MLNLTTEQFAEISSKVTLALPKALEGFSYEQAIELVEPENLKRAFAKTKTDFKVSTFKVSTFKHDMRKRGWKLLEDVPDAKLYEPDKFKLVEFLKSEKYMDGDKLVRKARKEFNTNFGQLQAEFFLENQAKIPLTWQGYNIIFPATIWRVRFGFRNVPYLFFYDGEWFLDFYWLVGGFYSRDRLLRLCE